MDVSNRGLVVAVYLLFAAVVAAIGMMVWLVWRPGENTAAALYVEPARRDTLKPTAPRIDEGLSLQRQEAFAEATRRIYQLETLI